MIRVGRHHPGFLAILAAVLALAGWAAPAQAGTPNTWTTVAPLPQGLLGPAVASAAGKLYVFGGFCGSGSCTKTFEAYDPQTNTWTALGEMPEMHLGLPSATTGPDGRIYLYGLPQSGSAVMLVYDPQAGTWSQEPPPPGIDEMAILVTGRDGRIYAVGGMKNRSVAGTLSAYDVHTHSWTSLAPDPTPRGQPGVSVGPDGRIYVLGGDGASATTRVEAYDPRSNAWTSVASLPTFRYLLQAVTGPDGRIYALGGEGRCFTAPCDEVEAYDVRTNTWTRVASMSHGRWNFAAAVGPDNRVYVLGGFTTPTEVQPGSLPTAVDAYTVAPADQPLPPPPSKPTPATRKLASMPTGRSDLGAATSGGTIYAIGGQAVTKSQTGAAPPPKPHILRAVEAYNPKTNTWAAAPPLPAPRMDMSVATGPDGRIYVLGGVATSPDQSENGGIPGLDTVFIYNPRTHRWSRGKPMPDGRYDLAAVTGKDGRIYTIGGATICYDLCEGMQTVRAFNPRTNTWTTLAPLPVWCLHPAVAMAPDGRIDVFGCDPTHPLLEVYDPRRNRWTELAGVPHLRTGFAVATAGDGRIDFIGGCLVYPLTQTGYSAYCGNPSPVDTYDPRTNTWTSLGVTLNARAALAATKGPDGRVYAIGGQGYGNGKLLEVIKSGGMVAAQAPGRRGRSEP